MPAILDRIRSQSPRFRGPVVGPIGNYISLVDESWAVSAESAIGPKVLQGFLVTNKSDLNALKQLFSQMRLRQFPAIEVYQGLSDHMYPNLRIPAQQFLTGMNAITIADGPHKALLHNFLVDRCHLERVVFFNDYRHCIQYINVRGSPPNVASGILRDGTMVRSICSSVSTSCFRRHSPLLGFNFQEVERQLYAERDDLLSKLSELDERRATKHLEMQQFQRQRRDLQNEIEKLVAAEIGTKKELRDAERKLEEQVEENNAYMNRFDQARILKDEVANLAQEEDNVKIQIEDVSKRLEKARAATAQYKIEFDKFTKEGKEIEKASADQSTLELNARQEITSRERAVSHYVKCQEDLEKNIKAAQTNADEHMPAYEAELAKAKEYCDPRKPSDTSSALHVRINAKVKTLEKRKSLHDGKSFADLRKEYFEAVKHQERFLSEFQTCSTTKDLLVQSLNKRIRYLKELKKRNAEMFSLMFNRFLNFRKFSGSIVVRKETLGVYVQTPENFKHSKPLPLSALSGGERSLATFCCVLALRDVTDIPLLIMDEIDVFMDEIYRKSILSLLGQMFGSNVARHSELKAPVQVIMLTPHNVPNFISSPLVKVFQLVPPRRGNQLRLQDMDLGN
eukprot:Rmarinus@m.3899